MYSLGEYICLLLIVHLKISLIYMWYIIYILKSTLKRQIFMQEYNLIKVYNKLKLYSLFKFNYNWRHCSAITLTVVMLCVCTKRVCVCDIELVCKAARLGFSCQTNAIFFPFIHIPWFITTKCTNFMTDLILLWRILWTSADKSVVFWDRMKRKY